jgi:hypothetical protein
VKPLEHRVIVFPAWDEYDGLFLKLKCVCGKWELRLEGDASLPHEHSQDPAYAEGHPTGLSELWVAATTGHLMQARRAGLARP